MAFLIRNWGRESVTYNAVTPTRWNYSGIENGVNDSLTDIKQDGYFNLTANSFVKLNDTIYVVGNDGVEDLKVTAVDPNVITVPFAIQPFFITVFASQFTSTNTPVNQVFVAPGVLPGDFAFIQPLNPLPSAARVILAFANNDEIGVEWDINPGTGIIFVAQVVRTV